MEEIYQKISSKQHAFSKQLLKIASYIHDDPKLFAMNSAEEVGKKMGVSESTVIRFCQKLGYSGYRALQADIQHQLFERSTLTEFIGQKSETYGGQASNSVKALMANDLQAIQQTMDRLSEAKLETAVATLASSDQTLVAGVRSSHALASWFAFALDLILGKTRVYQPHVDDVLLRISELTTKSVVVVFSFHRYAKDTIHLAKLAKQQGAFVMAFTDSPAAPVTKYASLTLPVQLQAKSTLDVAPTVMSITNSIISAISLENADQFQKRAARFDAIDGQDFFATSKNIN
ncbi:RpiR family transcriptional regulator [Lentibacillus kapialis]|uniref:RpiR family transcriptional regulator n=1 Tax=Lentibacillus kapialis TaxID=340214 RepID=A0A917PWS5_9BACI|nr:MurR/RpiR family transcriptional regulator [Lentibacillus kapialis]GGJ97062.1 RpiR family transcriptional regulator [Lentibacillus kapialis]